MHRLNCNTGTSPSVYSLRHTHASPVTARHRASDHQLDIPDTLSTETTQLFLAVTAHCSSPFGILTTAPPGDGSTILLTIPAAVALVVIPVPLVSVLFERGAFTTDDTMATALTVAVYGVGLPAFVLQKVLQPLFFAREDTRTPFRYALWSMAVNAVLVFGILAATGGLILWLASPLAVAIGGFGSVLGAFYGGIIIGLIQVGGGFFTSANYKTLFAYGLFLLIVLVRPHGLMGRK